MAPLATAGALHDLDVGVDKVGRRELLGAKAQKGRKLPGDLLGALLCPAIDASVRKAQAKHLPGILPCGCHVGQPIHALAAAQTYGQHFHLAYGSCWDT